VVKKRVRAFSGSDLEVLLRSMGVNHLVLTGIATSGAVLSTLREAADRDYELTVLSDACADADEEVHRVLIGKVFPRQAEVIAVEEWARQSPSRARQRAAGGFLHLGRPRRDKRPDVAQRRAVPSRPSRSPPGARPARHSSPGYGGEGLRLDPGATRTRPSRNCTG
jgi:Isochorismatase family